MDFAFLNALTRTTDAAAAGAVVRRLARCTTRYFGHYIVAALGKLCNIHPGLTFNLGIACFGALTAAAAFAAGSAATRPLAGRPAHRVLRRPDRQPGRRARGRSQRRTFNFDYFWATSRVIKDTINEYPFWSFLFADLHAHVLVMPFSLHLPGAGLWWVQRRDDARADASRRSPCCGLAARHDHGHQRLELADLRPVLSLSAGHAPSSAVSARSGGPHRWLVLLCVVLLLAPALALYATEPPQVTELVRSWGWSAPPRALCTRVALGGFALAAVALVPVLLRIAGAAAAPRRPRLSPLPALLVALHPDRVRNWGFEDQSFANFYDFANIFGLFLCIGIPFLFVLWRNRARVRRCLSGSASCAASRCGSFGLTVGACFVLSVPLRQRASAAHALARRRAHGDSRRFAAHRPGGARSPRTARVPAADALLAAAHLAAILLHVRLLRSPPAPTSSTSGTA